MLRIGKLTDYAMLIMSHLAKVPHAVVSATVLAEALTLKVPTVSKILKILAENGLVCGTRGAEGGYRLAKPANTITVAAIITAMEGEWAIMSCCAGAEVCRLHNLCTLKDNWLNINNLIFALLSRLTIVDMAKPLPLAALSQQFAEGVNCG